MPFRKISLFEPIRLAQLALPFQALLIYKNDASRKPRNYVQTILHILQLFFTLH